MGRTAQYTNAAEKQKAYRERKKQDEQRVTIALALLARAEEKEVTLRKQIAHHEKHHQTVLMRFREGLTFEFFDLCANGNFVNRLDTDLLHLLTLKGELELVEDKGFQGKFYRLRGQE